MVRTLPEELQIDHISLDPKKGSSPGSSYKMSEGFFFGPHHLIMAALLYLREGSQEEASKSRLHSTPLPKAAMPSFGASGYPSEPQLEKEREYAPGQPQPAARRASPRHIPEDSYSFQSNLAQELAAIKACQEQMLASQAQQAAILRQLQVHFDLPQAVEPSTSTPPEPHSQPSESHPPEPEAPADPPTEEADPSA
ncbi:hypothetical protein CK203_085193 [Vitis vinifera]|uniref:Uncharacterized protein n=1 Tax=Vitis vinifera TaxID=29760 RepID=A0A438E0N0_VITVI|nr:hypothetical protein CK203_085193 [Vitis vinifera]